MLYEGWTESFSQVYLNTLAIRRIGIESPVQYVSFGLSLVTLTKCIAQRISIVKHNREAEVLSIRFVMDLIEAIINIFTCLLGYLFLLLTNNETMPGWMQFTFDGILIHGPIFGFTLMSFTGFSPRMMLHHFNATAWLSIFGLTYLFHFVSTYI